MTLGTLKTFFLNDSLFWGNESQEVFDLKPFSISLTNRDITYVLHSCIPNINTLIESPATAFITDYLASEKHKELLIQNGKSIIYNKNARLQLAYIANAFVKPHQMIIGDVRFPEASVSNNAYIGENVSIGNGTMVYPNVTIYNDVKIGRNCIIHSGTVIGADGFGYEKDKQGNMIKIAHLGSVVIGHHVEVGANTCIDRGTLGDTIIEDGVKIDNLVHIAHNVHIQKNVVVIANSMIAGSVVLEEGAWIAPSSSIRETKRVGKNALVGLGSVVVSDVSPNTTVMGVPAKPRG